MSKNTMPEMYDETPAGVEIQTTEEILMNEDALLRGLIEPVPRRTVKRHTGKFRSAAMVF